MYFLPLFSVAFRKTMAGRSDLAGFLKGLNLIRLALAETQGKEARHAWNNSSVKAAAEQVAEKIQENMSGQGADLSKIPVSCLRISPAALATSILT